MMLKQLNRRLRDRAVVTAAILSFIGYDVACAAEAGPMGGADRNDHATASPIKSPVNCMYKMTSHTW